MQSPDVQLATAALFTDLVGGAAKGGGAFILNSGDIGLLRSPEGANPSSPELQAQDGGKANSALSSMVRLEGYGT